MAEQKPDSGVEGEGSYSGARDYSERTKQFIEREGEHIEDIAEDAAEALDGPEKDQLRQAEEDGLGKARH